MIFPRSLLFLATVLPAAAATPVGLRDLPLLFADDSGVASSQALTRTVHPARTRAAPVMVADQPWEYQRVYMWGTVHRDTTTGGFQMWYLSRLPPEIDPQTPTRTLYATSTDGLRWEKPGLAVETFPRFPKTNIIDGETGSCAVWVDSPDSGPGPRYKMLAARHRGYFALTSADGIHWQPMSETPALSDGDTVTLTRDPVSGDYLAYHKRAFPSDRGYNVRVVWLARSSDFKTWSRPEKVFAADAADDDGWVSLPTDRTEVYDMAVFPHAAGFIGLPAIFRNRPQVLTAEDRAAGAVAPDGPIDIQLATSSDGHTWRRSWPRVALIPRGAPGTFDGGALLNTACAPVHVGDETWVYYTAINAGHGKRVPPKAIAIGRAEWRLHGYASLDAGPDGGELQTVPLRFAHPTLSINANARRGRLQVALLEADGRPIPGYTLADSLELTQDAVRWSAVWKNQRTVPTDRPVRVVIALTSTELYSLSSRP